MNDYLNVSIVFNRGELEYLGKALLNTLSLGFLTDEAEENYLRIKDRLDKIYEDNFQ